MAGAGRPKGIKNIRRKGIKKLSKLKLNRLRLKFYTDMPSSEGGSVTGISDKYGRMMEEYVNEEGILDVRPTGHCIAARH